LSTICHKNLYLVRANEEEMNHKGTEGTEKKEGRGKKEVCRGEA
jgi:hypothetical protein